MKYIATINEQQFEIEIGHDNEILVNGERYETDFNPLPDSGMVSLLLNNHSWEAVVEERDEMHEVLLKGELYSVLVQDERTYRMAQARGVGTAVTGEANVTAPMPGLIVTIPVNQGDAVSKGDSVVILESMKMENELRAPRDGVILRVSTQPGASVEKGQVLVVIGDEEES
ncbi:MAG: acetyl-CoA carboxylase biotin carboxyl carrier protein subunit [Chloroflexota bacterium]